MSDPLADLERAITAPDEPMTEVFIQWKGTDVCLDFDCQCGYQSHFDGGFAYSLCCAICGRVFMMPQVLKLPEGGVDFMDPALAEGEVHAARQYPDMVRVGDPGDAHVLRAVAETLHVIANGLAAEVSAEDLHRLAAVVAEGRVTDWMCCPLCEETTCDAGCPLAAIRS